MDTSSKGRGRPERTMGFMLVDLSVSNLVNNRPFYIEGTPGHISAPPSSVQSIIKSDCHDAIGLFHLLGSTIASNKRVNSGYPALALFYRHLLSHCRRREAPLDVLEASDPI